ncbi:adhesive plaque matrix protein-like [Homarus americanus]|uniref:adhesive plaque matrix protein-like n=1 Tax=Homarus americanus TaxID=6706 RepID=UPI001C437EAA|nr:adhesive plaque matrix protein-like [Homarus americanus]
MAFKFVVLAGLALGALADRAPVYPSYSPPAASYPAPPTYAPLPPKYPAPSPYGKEPEYPTAPPKYAYNYDVADHYSGANFAASEARDGYKTEGSYTVDLPDGRTQTVTYVDNGDGLEAVVTYEGEAQYPEYNPAPAYKPAPVYKPAPPVYKPAPKYPQPPQYPA